MTESLQKEGNHVRNSIFTALIITFTVAVFFIAQQFFSENFCPGIRPLSIKDLYGIILYPFFHSDLSHLFSNIPPLFFLLAGTFYYLPRRFFPALLTIWLVSGGIIWIGGRTGCHLGASGIIYGLAFMLATLGFLKKQRALGAFALIIVFLYGSMIWGVLPQDGNVSWEGHAGGAFAGIMLAVLWRKYPVYTEKFEPVIEENFTPDNASASRPKEHDTTDRVTSSGDTPVYHFKPQKK